VEIGDKVRVKKLTHVDNYLRNRVGTVVRNSNSGEVVFVEFEDEAITH
jgi:hypothetical protein